MCVCVCVCVCVYRYTCVYFRVRVPLCESLVVGALLHVSDVAACVRLDIPRYTHIHACMRVRERDEERAWVSEGVTCACVVVQVFHRRC